MMVLHLKQIHAVTNQLVRCVGGNDLGIPLMYVWLLLMWKLVIKHGHPLFSLRDGFIKSPIMALG